MLLKPLQYKCRDLDMWQFIFTNLLLKERYLLGTVFPTMAAAHLWSGIMLCNEL